MSVILGKLKTLESTESSVGWEIENFSAIDAPIGVRFKSPIFTTKDGTRKMKWQLELYPGGYDEENKESLGLFLTNLSEWKVLVDYTLLVFDKKCNVVTTHYSKEQSFEARQGWGRKSFIKKSVVFDETKKVLINDTLHICCIVKSTLTNVEQCNEEEVEQNDAQAHFQLLLDTGDSSDVTFEIENKRMRLHKVIVTSISPVFQSMFQHQMREKEESVVHISDVKYDVMKEVFRYIYVRKALDIENIVDDLLVAADKYAIRGLKAMCERKIYENVNESNALQYLEFAVKYNTTFLKANVTEFITSRLANFVHTPEFEKMDSRCKDELLRAVAKKKFKDQ